jgi:DNA-binding transcriptional LysR family regulator
VYSAGAGMDLKRLKYFCAVIEHGGINKAAHILNIAQPPLSKRIQELEEELGISLFHRNDRKLEPTVAGLYLFERACFILQEIGEAVKNAQSIATAHPRQVKIGMTHLFQKFFNSLIVEIINRNNGIEFGVSIADSSQLEQQLQKGEIDIALVQRPNLNDNYASVPLASIGMVAQIGAGIDIPKDKKNISLKELSKHPLILIKRNAGKGSYEALLEQFKNLDVTPNIIMGISQPASIVSLIDSGVCAVSILPKTEIDARELKTSTIMDITDAQDVFFPAAVMLKKSSPIDEVMKVIFDIYPAREH